MSSRNTIVAGLILVLAIGLLIVVNSCSKQTPAPTEITPPPMPPTPTETAPAETIRQIGSTTVLPIAEAWQKAFNKLHPEVKIAVSGGGSGAGIKALIDGTCEIANASRAIKDQEVTQAQAAGVEPVEHVVAFDGIAVIVHPDNPIAELSVEQLSDIFSGEVTAWKNVGGQAGQIQIISRDSASGTYESFKELVVTLHGKAKDRDYAPEALKQASNQAVLTTVAQTPSAIGYVGLGYLDDTVKAVKVIPIGGGDAVAATAENVQNGSYPISRELYMYTNGEPSGAVKEYLDWGLGSDAQAIVAEKGFVSIAK